MFSKECLFYDVILPKLQIERSKRGLEKLPIPKCFFANPDPGAVIMNNLKDDGFEMLKNKPEKFRRLYQEDHIILFLKLLASLHASTYHLIDQTGLLY